MHARRLTATDPELTVLSEALRECLAAELLTPSSVAIARELLDKVDARSTCSPTSIAAARRERGCRSAVE